MRVCRESREAKAARAWCLQSCFVRHLPAPLFPAPFEHRSTPELSCLWALSSSWANLRHLPRCHRVFSGGQNLCTKLLEREAFPRSIARCICPCCKNPKCPCWSRIKQISETQTGCLCRWFLVFAWTGTKLEVLKVTFLKSKQSKQMVPSFFYNLCFACSKIKAANRK